MSANAIPDPRYAASIALVPAKYGSCRQTGSPFPRRQRDQFCGCRLLPIAGSPLGKSGVGGSPTPVTQREKRYCGGRALTAAKQFRMTVLVYIFLPSQHREKKGFKTPALISELLLKASSAAILICLPILKGVFCQCIVPRYNFRIGIHAIWFMVIGALYGRDGKNFTSPERISNDNWVINGCPHKALP